MVLSKTNKGKSASFQRRALKWVKRETSEKSYKLLIQSSVTMLLSRILGAFFPPRYVLIDSTSLQIKLHPCLRLNMQPVENIIYPSKYRIHTLFQLYSCRKPITESGYVDLRHPQVSCNSAQVSPTYRRCRSSTKRVSWWSSNIKNLCSLVWRRFDMVKNRRSVNVIPFFCFRFPL